MNIPIEEFTRSYRILFEAICKNSCRVFSVGRGVKIEKGIVLLLFVNMCFLFLSLLGCEDRQHFNEKKETHVMKKRIINPWNWQEKHGFVQANEITNAQRMLFTAGIVSVDNEGILLHGGDMEKQINQILDNMIILLEQANAKLSDVVRFTYYTTDVPAFIAAGPVLIDRLEKAGCKPATSLIGVDSLFHPDCVVEIEAIVVN